MASKYRWFKYPRRSLRASNSGRGNYCPDPSRKCYEYWSDLLSTFLSSLTCNSCYHFLGGQSFVIKLRPTVERSSTSMVIEPPQTLINSVNDTSYIRWRHMKYASSITHSLYITHNILSFSDMLAVSEHLSFY